jgi:hypothetical protein
VKLFNTEFTETPICTASRQYQKLKLEQIESQDLSDEHRAAMRESVLAKSCICHDLGGGVTLKNGIDPAATPAVCCGPNVVNFSRAATLEEMVGHIYGRISLLCRTDRPHMFVRELELYVDYLRNLVEKHRLGLCSMPAGYVGEYKENLLAGIEYYRQLAEGFAAPMRAEFLASLAAQQKALDAVADHS